MIPRRFHTSAFTWLLLLCLLVTPASLSGFVWCLGDDGHAQVELATAGDCAVDRDMPPPVAGPGVALDAGEDRCGPCLDLSSSHRWGSPRGRNSLAPASLPVALAPVVVALQRPLPDRFLTSRLVIDPAPRTPQQILHHRTIVLLT